MFFTIFAAAALAAAEPVPPAAQPAEPQTPAASSAAPVEKPVTEPSSTAPAEPGDAQAVAAITAPPVPCCKIAALTPIELEIVNSASSKTSKQGDHIELRVIDAVRVDGKIVIPAGTTGSAEVIQASRGAFGGKAGELVIGAPYLMLGTQRIGLKRLRYGPASGRDRTNEAMWISAMAGGIFGMLDGGGNIDVKTGSRANAVVTTETFVPVQP